MKQVTVTAFGREWSHQQFHGLIEDLAYHEYSVMILKDYGSFCSIMSSDREQVFVGCGSSVWLALVDAIGKMGGEG